MSQESCCCKGSKIRCDNVVIGETNEPLALWRKKDGVEWFMGIVGIVMKFIKLDDPAGELDSPGHEMDDAEFLTECYHYDNFRAKLPPIKTDLHLIDFSTRPDFTDTQEEKFDIKFPFGIPNDQRRHIGPTPQIRNGDTVRVISSICVFVERFWVRVISVTAFGMVTGFLLNDLKFNDVEEDIDNEITQEELVDCQVPELNMVTLKNFIAKVSAAGE